jgi:hypothetical protein
MTRQFVGLSTLFALLAAVSLGLKDRAPAARDGSMPAIVTARLAGAMAEQGFTVTIEPHPYQSAVALGVRGACRIGARDASAGPAFDIAFRQQAAAIGALRYAYRGHFQSSLPRVRLFVDKIVPRTLDRFGIHLARPVPVAIAASPECPADPLTLPDLDIRP